MSLLAGSAKAILKVIYFNIIYANENDVVVFWGRKKWELEKDGG